MKDEQNEDLCKWRFYFRISADVQLQFVISPLFVRQDAEGGAIKGCVIRNID